MDNSSNNGDLDRTVRNRLLEAAAESFAEKGFDGTSVRDITAKASCNVAAVNYHFGGKENLYFAVFRRYMAEMRDIRIAAIESRTFPSHCRRVMETLHEIMKRGIKP